MKKLYLLRHANTHPSTTDDKNRIITPKGVKEIKSIAEQLLTKQITFDLILCSTALRTKQTLHHLEDFMDKGFYTEYKDSLYNPTLEEFISTIQETPDHVQNIMTISHNPTTSEIANYLTDESNISFSTANLLALDLNINDWNEISKGCAKAQWQLKPNI